MKVNENLREFVDSIAKPVRGNVQIQYTMAKSLSLTLGVYPKNSDASETASIL
jgi:hypothetical protein